jgi:hypothetical protein
MKQIIKFEARNEYGWDVAERPYPASQSVPDWWKAMTPYSKSEDNPDGKKLIVRNFESNASPKKCVPMLDAMLSGYIIPLWSDVQVTNDGQNGKSLTWRAREDIFQAHGFDAANVETPIGYSNQVFKFMNRWRIHTPKGYSCLITQPFGYRQTGVQAIPAIVDTDVSSLEILPPVWFAEDFEGILEAGTPMVQVTPFKRSDWKAEYSYLKDGEYERIEEKNFRRHIVNHYVRKVWQKKDYS